VYGIKEAARQAGITEEQLASWIKSGKVEATEELTELTGTGKYLFDEAAIKHIHQLAQLAAREPQKPAGKRTA
jgi:predicted site-specific integrase-resolvase